MYVRVGVGIFLGRCSPPLKFLIWLVFFTFKSARRRMIDDVVALHSRVA